MSEFVHLHCHSEYSLLDGLSRPEQLIEVAEENGQSHVAMTDHGTMGGYFRFQEAANKSHVTPIFGLESYFVPDINNDDKDTKAERFHLILLAENQQGLRNLMKLNRLAWTDGFYSKPRTDFEMLEEFGDGIIALSGCMGGSISQSIINDDIEQADKLMERFMGIFGDRFYLELQPWLEPDQQKVNAKLLDYADYLGVPAVGTIDCHYPRKENRGAEEVLLAVGMSSGFSAKDKEWAAAHIDLAKAEPDVVKKMNILWPNRRIKFDELPLYVMPTNEAVEAFEGSGYFRPELIENSQVIADRCKAELIPGKGLLPSYTKSIGLKVTAESYLEDIAYFRLKEMGLDTEKYREVMKMELDIILGKNFSDYFLILWDICKWADRQGIRRGPARGSSGGSLLTYCLGITDVDPVKYDLLFWRFLNPERNDYPDIDIDFEHKRRDEVKAYARERWGSDNVASIATYGYFHEKSSFKDVSRVLGAPYKLSNGISARIKTLDQVKDLAKDRDDPAYGFMRDYPASLDIASTLMGTIRQAGAHAAGVVISPDPLDWLLPIESRKDEDSDDRIEVTAFDKNEVEKMGLIKFDALSLVAVSVIGDCVDKIKEVHGVDVYRQSLNHDDPDPRIFEELRAERTVGVFQSEGDAYTAVLRDIDLQTFDDMVVANGLIRPGAWKTQGEKYLARKRGDQAVTYASPILEPILESTYGTWIFEEQLMRSLVALAGFSWGQADRFRKIISKKLDASAFEPYKIDFMEGVTKHVSQSVAESLWADILTACEYMFNKSHSVGYSLLTYQTAWLKNNYPTEYVWALLNNETNNANVTTYLFEAQRLGVEILPPDINKSEASFSLEGKAIRFGLGNVMNCGPSAIKEIMSKRPFVSFDQFVNVCAKTRVKAHITENLEKVGAFESLGHQNEYEYESYYGAILNYPIFLNEKSEFDDILTPCNEVDESSELYIIRGVVKDTKRTDKFYRVTIEDSSGTLAVFANQSVELNKRDSIIAMVGDSSLHYVEDYKKALAHTPRFVKLFQAIKSGSVINQYDFLLDEDTTYSFDDPKTIMYLISVASFKTKKGQLMGNAYMWNSESGFVKAVIFPQKFAYLKHIWDERLFSWNLIQTSEPKGGGIAVDKIVEPEKYCKMKGIVHKPLPAFSLSAVL